MASDRKSQGGNRIPIRFEGEDVPEEEFATDALTAVDDDFVELESQATSDAEGGPAVAELVATRAELKRLQNALAEAQEAVLRRQADFENYRKRVERERGETHHRLVGDVAKNCCPLSIIFRARWTPSGLLRPASRQSFVISCTVLS